ncbi:nuclear transport factor 2 family protein [Streptomyces sp. Vc74B-19]|uniref:nuclear transport factor 2 family protein n=1 Tax=unclassified Streptomyces TaxID=2593676 RepID=UPI001BFC4729|nr:MULTISPECIES: nuclear transport factor 2 family protein [unclassified Streptomyces]MBT3162225.1 nuclear transport factor 2 family protein [Streptomyces sp. Vc74B-19]MCO4696450.1 nuclear transport factor 2 family protein [Streptomyces sp. RO-S4]MDU0305487.1 nuclear transport factor 2 family protein [Streptomyces sp. PAL114]
MTGLEEITRRLDALEAIESIKQLKARYFRFVDEKKWDDLTAVFTPDAKVVTDGIAFDSPRHFASLAGGLIAAAPTVHHGHMPEIEVTGPDTAKGIWSMEDLLTYPAGPDAPEGHHGYGQYHETYRKVDGKWLIESLDLTRFRKDPLENWTPEAN